MVKKVICLAVVFMLSGITAQQVDKIHDAGPPANRVNLVLIGDGYTEPEILWRWAPYVQDISDYLLQDSVESFIYCRYRNYINVYRIDLISPVSGISNQNPLEGDTACFDFTTGNCQVNWGKTNAAIDNAMAPLGVVDHWRIVSLNGGGGRAATHYPPNGQTLCVLYQDEGVPFVALHEGGHAFHLFADEYETRGGGVYRPRTHPD
jgi:hypothetical protein